MSTISFADELPNLLHSKNAQSDYSYFDATKLKLFAGPSIWKYTNLLNGTKTSTETNSNIRQQQQALNIRQRNNVDRGNVGVVGSKRSIRVDVFNQLSAEQIMSGTNNTRDKKTLGISQSALLLRLREKSLNQMQLARKVRPITDLTNLHNFPKLNFEYLHLINRNGETQKGYYDHDDFGDHHFHVSNEYHDDEGNNAAHTFKLWFCSVRRKTRETALSGT